MGDWTKFYQFYGGYAKSGNAQDVALVGGETKPYPFGVNLERANKSGFAKGIRFKNNDRVVTLECSLAPIVLNFKTAKPIYDKTYVNYGGKYDWFLEIATSDDPNAKSDDSKYKTIQNEKVLTHNWYLPFLYKEDGQGGLTWRNGCKSSSFSKTFTVGENVKWVRFILSGDNPKYPKSIYLKIEQIILPPPPPKPKKFRPFAIRKGQIFKSLNTESGFLKIRKSGSFQDIELMKFTDTNNANMGSCQIRKGGVFVGQGKFGE